MRRTVRRKIKSSSADRITDEKRCYRFDRCDYWACRSLSEVATYSINTGISRASDRYARCCVLVKIRPINNRCNEPKKVTTVFKLSGRNLIVLISVKEGVRNVNTMIAKNARELRVLEARRSRFTVFRVVALIKTEKLKGAKLPVLNVDVTNRRFESNKSVETK